LTVQFISRYVGVTQSFNFVLFEWIQFLRDDNNTDNGKQFHKFTYKIEHEMKILIKNLYQTKLYL
jgi:hypothetical protein